MSASEWGVARRLTAEAVGTGFLLATVVGSGIMGDRLDGVVVGLALLGNTIATGAILAVLILIHGPVSGAHFNPVVTLSFLIRGEIGARLAAAYVVVQVVGSILGVWAAHVMFEEPIWMLSTTTRPDGAQWFAEGVATFGLVATILDCVRFRPDAVPYAVGLFITAGYWFTASTSFANPAVTVARALTDTFSGISPADVPMFIVSQLAGTVLATLLFGWLLKDDR